MGKAQKKFSQPEVVSLDDARKLSKKKFSPHDLCSLIPKNPRQEEFIRLFYDGAEVLVASGYAGTGKTFLSMYLALNEVFRSDTPYDKVMIVRSAVQTRDIGFTKGDNDEKNAPYEAPYRSICSDLLGYGNAYDMLKALRYVEFDTTGFLRGNTFDRTIVIVDEAACMNYHELATITTRLGNYSRLIVCGDVLQDDLAQKGKKNDVSGFRDYLNVIEMMPPSMYGIVEYEMEDIVRSGLVREFIIADSKY